MTENLSNSVTKMQTQLPERIVTEGEMSELLSVSRQTVYALRKAGVIPFVRRGVRGVGYEPMQVITALRTTNTN